MANASVSVVENETPSSDLDRLRSAVAQRQRVVDELGDAPAKVEEKYDRYTKHRAAELAEAKRMVAQARRDLKEAKAALDAAEKGA